MWCLRNHHGIPLNFFFFLGFLVNNFNPKGDSTLLSRLPCPRSQSYPGGWGGKPMRLSKVDHWRGSKDPPSHYQSSTSQLPWLTQWGFILHKRTSQTLSGGGIPATICLCCSSQEGWIPRFLPQTTLTWYVIVHFIHKLLHSLSWIVTDPETNSLAAFQNI